MKFEPRVRATFAFRDDTGSAAVEFAMILGVIVTLTLGSLFFLGSQSRDTFYSIKDLTALTKNSKLTNQTINHVEQTVQDSNETKSSGKVEPKEGISSTVAQRLIFAAIAALMMGILFYSLKLRRVVRKHNDFHGLPVSSEQLQAAEQRKFAKRQMILQTLECELDSLFNNEMDVRQLMTQPVNYVLPSSRTADVRKLMKQDNVRHYPVCDKGGRLVGILSDRDILASDAKYVSECMTTNICTVRSDSKVSPAITMMFNHGISSLPIVDDGKLVGLLTTTDLVMTLQCTLQILQKSEAGLDLVFTAQHNAFPVKFQPPVLKS